MANNQNNTTNKIINLRQITRANGKNKLVEFNDHMSSNDFSQKGGQLKTNVHSIYSKIEIIMVDWSLGKKSKAKVLKHNMNVPTMKAIADAIISGNMNLFTGKSQGFTQQKIDIYKPDANNNNLCPVSKITIKYESAMNNPWTITLENGFGYPEKSATGGVKIKSGSYKKESESKLALSIESMIEKMIEVRDYINYFETYHMPAMIKTRNRLEKIRIEEYKKNKENNANQYEDVENIEQYAADTSGYINNDEEYIENSQDNYQYQYGNNQQYENGNYDNYNNNYDNSNYDNSNYDDDNNNYTNNENQYNNQAPLDENHCISCGNQVEDSVKKFSNNGFGATICRECQTHCSDCGATNIPLKNAVWSFKNKGRILCVNCQHNS